MRMSRGIFVHSMISTVLSVVFLFSLSSCGPKPTPTSQTLPTVPQVAGMTVQPAQTTAKPTVLPPTATNTPVPEPDTPPVLLSMAPQPGEEIAPTGLMTITFNQPIDPASAAGALQFDPPIPGTVNVHGQQLIFTPQKPLAREATYKLHLRESLQAKNGLHLTRPLTVRFQVAGLLKVSSVQPADGSAKVDPTSKIVAVFNRPVVPLTSVEKIANLPGPLTITPRVAGHGEWLNSALYQFIPDAPLAAGQMYTVQIDPNLQDMGGNPLAKPVMWRFTVQPPKLMKIVPKAQKIAPTQLFTLTFNTALDPASLQSHWHFINLETQQEINGTFAWPQPQQLVFRPTSRLPMGTSLRLTLAAGVQTADHGSQIPQTIRHTWQTFALPAVLRTEPANGATNFPPMQSVMLHVAGNWDRDTLTDKTILIAPKPKGASYWYGRYDNRVQIYFAKEAHTRYTITLRSDIKDIYGNTLGKNYQFSFTTGDFSPSATVLRSGGSVSAYDSYQRPVKVAIRYRNVGKLHFRLYALPQVSPAELDQWNSKPSPNAELLREWDQELANPADNQFHVALIPLAGKDKSLAEGFYRLLVSASGKDIYKHRSSFNYKDDFRFFVTPYNIVLKSSATGALVWVTDLHTGEPVANVSLRLFREDSTIDGRTDADGLWRTTFTTAANPWKKVTVFSNPQAPNGYATNRGPTVEGWAFDLPTQYGIPGSFNGDLYTDRPIYRPGQTVYWKGIIRSDDDGAYSVPPAGTIAQVTIRDPEGNKIVQTEQPLNEMGTLNGKLPLDEKAPLGRYQLIVQLGEHDTFYQPFLVAEYRKPEFQLDVSTDKKDYLAGEKITAQLQATYFFGGPLNNAEVEWHLLRHDAPFSWHCPASATCPNYHFEGFDYWTWRRPGEAWDKSVSDGSGVTDANGFFTVTLPVDMSNTISAQRFTVEFAVKGSNGQYSAGRTAVRAHHGAKYIGSASKSYVYRLGDESEVDFIAVDYHGQILARQPFTVTVAKTTWHNVKKEENGNIYWVSEMVTTPVISTTLRTGADGKVAYRFRAPDAGSYLIEAAVTDAAGRVTIGKNYIWVAGANYIPWARQNSNHLQIVADKESYKPGDVAKVLVTSPYSKPVEALISVERGGVLDVYRQTLASNNQILEIPIAESYVPNVFISVLAVQGDAANEDRIANTKVGYIELKVSDVNRQLHVTLTGKVQQAQPRQWVTYTLTAQDAAGNPVSAEFSVSVIDKAVLLLSTEGLHTLRERFYAERGLGISTFASSFLSMEEIMANIKTNEALSPKGGGGGGTGVNARHYFPDNAYWRAVVNTDAKGKALFSFRLPDNLTTWQIKAKGVDANTRVGEAKSDLTVNLPFMVRPVAPRFLTVGDQPEVAAIVHNNSNKSVSAHVTLAVQGASIDGEATQTVSIPPAGRKRVAWPLRDVLGIAAPNGAGQIVHLQWQGQAGALHDSVALTLPVYNYSTPEVTATAGTVPTGGTILEGVVLPPDAQLDRSQGTLKITLQPSLAAAMQDGLHYLQHYPYECTEQIVSRFLPNIITYRVLQQNGIKNDALRQALQEQVSTSLQKLYASQQMDGGWGWWPQDRETSPYITAYALWGLSIARANGFPVSESVLSRAARYMGGQLKTLRLSSSDYLFNQQAFYLFVLSEYERVSGQHSSMNLHYAVNAFAQRQKLNIEGKALLAMSLKTLGGPEADVKALRSDLNNTAQTSGSGVFWEEKSPAWRLMGSDTRTTAVVLTALTRLTPRDGRLPMVVRWLMAARSDGHWSTTQETAWSLIALSNWLQLSGALHPDYQASVQLNNVPLWQSTVTEKDVQAKIVLQKSVQALLRNNLIALRRRAADDGQDTGQLYYLLDLRLFRPVEQIKPLNRGFVVQRSYTLYGHPDKPIAAAHVGDVIDVHLSLILPADRLYVMVEDPIPAGTEPLDVNLNTTSRTIAGPGLSKETPQGQPDYWFWRPEHTEMHDQKVSFFARWLPAGSYDYHYQVRATLPGRYLTPPTVASDMYFPELFGRTGGGTFQVLP